LIWCLKLLSPSTRIEEYEHSVVWKALLNKTHLELPNHAMAL